MIMTSIEKNRFFKKINIPKNKNDCWLWMACKNHNGYGRFVVNGILERSTRVMYVLHYGLFDKKLLVRHSCHNPECVNIDHLSLGTNKENTQDAVRAGRMARGEKSGLAKLKKSQVLDIRERLKNGETRLDLRIKFKVSQYCIYAIAHRLSWKHI